MLKSPGLTRCSKRTNPTVIETTAAAVTANASVSGAYSATMSVSPGALARNQPKIGPSRPWEEAYRRAPAAMIGVRTMCSKKTTDSLSAASTRASNVLRATLRMKKAASASVTSRTVVCVVENRS